MTFCCALPVVVLSLVTQSAAAPAPAPPSAAPLFERYASVPLVLRLETDLHALTRDRGEKRKQHPAILRYTELNDTGSLQVKLRTRGIFRLKTCGFPPLRLDLPRHHLEGTPFAGQDKLKLVTHCQKDRGSERNLLQEYALYRVFNVLSDTSFRARLVLVTYVDTTRAADTLTRHAFLLESEDGLAARLGAALDTSKKAHDLLADPEYMTLVSMFQYLIGNTDWSVWGLHNIALFRLPTNTLLAIPYDFDFSGAVSAPYAVPAPQLPIRSVHERLYRGYCQPEDVVQRVVARFRATKDSVYSAVRAVPDLEPRDVSDLLDYFDGFYRVIEDPGAVRREFVRGCRQLPQQ